MVDRRETKFYAKWLADPVPLRRVTARFLASLSRTPAAVPYARNRLPVLEINPTRDEMVSPTVTRRNFERLGGPKTYVELPLGRWALGPAFVSAWTDAADRWGGRRVECFPHARGEPFGPVAFRRSRSHNVLRTS